MKTNTENNGNDISIDHFNDRGVFRDMVQKAKMKAVNKITGQTFSSNYCIFSVQQQETRGKCNKNEK